MADEYNTALDLLLDDVDGDLVIDSDIRLARGLVAIKQGTRLKLTSFKGEWFLDLDKGLPYYELVFVKNPNYTLIETTFRDTILSQRGIRDILTFGIVPANKTRQAQIAFKSSTDLGELLDQTVKVLA